MQNYFPYRSSFSSFNSLWLSFVLCFSFISLGFSQTGRQQFGKVDRADLEMTSYDKDPDAEALVLFDYASAKVIAEVEGSKIKTFRHRRVKILKKEGLDYGDVSLSYFSWKNTQYISKLEAQVINLVDGKEVITVLTKKDFFKEEINDRYNRINFAFPALQEGSILEYKYTLVSNNIFSPDTWYFQEDIPVRWSEYRFETPHYYQYVFVYSKSKDFHINDPEVNRFVMIDMPGLKPEPYVTTMDDYYAKMQFQLSEYSLYMDRPNIKEQVLTTWDDLAADLLGDEHFGKQIQGRLKDKKIAQQAKALTTGQTDSLAMLDDIFQLVSKSIEFNGRYRFYIKTSLNQALANSSGSSADINMSLVAALRASGFVADPVLISTRTNGKLQQTYPILRQFNHVLVRTVVDGKVYLMDAINPNRPYFLLGINDLNRLGLLITPEPKWINITPKNNLSNSRIILRVNEEGVWEGKKSSAYDAYRAVKKRALLYSDDNEKAYMESFFKDKPDFQPVAVTVKDLEDPTTRLRDELTFEGGEFEADDLLYIAPTFFSSFKENPFKLKKRNYPVDFAHPITEINLFNLEIPKGYAVEEIPKNTMISLYEDAASFTFQIKEFNGYVQLSARLIIDQVFFQATEYEDLKMFLDKVAVKFSEQIVLKKSEE